MPPMLAVFFGVVGGWCFLFTIPYMFFFLIDFFKRDMKFCKVLFVVAKYNFYSMGERNDGRNSGVVERRAQGEGRAAFRDALRG